VRSLVVAVIVAATVASGGRPAGADVAIATDPAVPAVSRPSMMGLIGFGIANADDLDGPGYLGRMEVMAFPLWRDAAHPGVIVGFGYGFEYWRAGADNWGLALPAGMQLGARVGPMHGVIGFGIHAVVVDQIDDDTGVGAYSPYASAAIGLHLGPATIVVDGRIDHRLLYGADDRTQWSLGIMVGMTGDLTPSRRPIR
jgi:hypothetical protein